MPLVIRLSQALPGGKHQGMMRHNQVRARCQRIVNHAVGHVQRKVDARHLRLWIAHQQAGIVEIRLCVKRRKRVNQLVNPLHRQHGAPSNSMIFR